MYIVLHNIYIIYILYIIYYYLVFPAKPVIQSSPEMAYPPMRRRQARLSWAAHAFTMLARTGIGKNLKASAEYPKMFGEEVAKKHLRYKKASKTWLICSLIDMNM